MAKAVDISKIDGYGEMTPEQKVAALEALEVADPDYTGFVKKDVFDKTASELASVKKQLREKMSDDEAQKQKEQEEREALQTKYDELLHKTIVSENKSKLLAMGYDETLADETAEAMANGEQDKVFANQKKHLAAFEKKVRAEVLKDTPKPTPDGDSKIMTLDKFRKLNPTERHKFSMEHPEEYKELYGGN